MPPFMSKEEREENEIAIALQKQSEREDKKTAGKWALGLGAVGLLALFIFGKKGNGGTGDPGAGGYDGSAGSLDVKLSDGPTFTLANGTALGLDAMIATAKQANVSLNVTTPGNVTQKYIDQSKILLVRAGIKANWN